jgi:hypothetical protein
MRVLQASPAEPANAIGRAREFGCRAIAWNLREPCVQACEEAARAGLGCEGWIQIARDPEAAAAHPEWMHCPQHHEWLQRFPAFKSGHPALVAPYICLNTRPAFEYALETNSGLLAAYSQMRRIWLADIQGPPMGCGCGNPSCRSWDNAPGEKLAPTPYHHPTTFFSLEFFRAVAAAGGPRLVPVLCAECERGIRLGDVEDPDGPAGTDLCRGITCSRPCALDYWPALLRAFREEQIETGLLLATEALGRNHPVYGPPRAWAKKAHQHFGLDLIPCVEPEDAFAFESCLIMTDAPQDCWPVAPPEGYVPEVPPIMCGYCPPEEAG